MIRSLSLLAATAAAAGAIAVTASAASSPADDSGPVAAQAALPTVRLDGIGPLRLGMRLRAALATRWIAQRGRGCELAGPPLPITYQLSGPSAPAGVRAIATFDGSSKKLTSLAFMRGVRTATGVVVGRTTATGMANSYRAAGFAARASFDSVFGGTFATVRRSGHIVIMGFARGRPSARRAISILGIPFVPVCE
jgi:hypothetical protein